MYLRTGSANRKSAKQPICGRSANLTNYSNPHFCGFAKLTVFANRPPLDIIGPQRCSIERLMYVVHQNYYYELMCKAQRPLDSSVSYLLLNHL